ncbi:winged helix-turn-helix domain-containing protein [Myxococcus sp. AM010]|uniref:winged helix-turn-helix domain-containing protein n=1 Tax=Myxococcus sp. AM010 TaxID=2745138 RepID=UPI0015957CAC|nr:winged helix-turn-helix transcriptional regulator [Myxococcus sp. AM010]
MRTSVVYGLPGAGKSALAAAVAARHPGTVVHRRLRPGDSLGTVVDDLRRLLRDAPVQQALSDEARLDDLARQADASEALCVVDDLQVLRPEERAALLEELGGRLTRGALLATSREAVPRRATSPDRFELRLDGLTEAAARTLWRQLDALYGAHEGFEHAWRRSRGLPFHLRRAHAGDVEGEEPVLKALLQLSADERRLASVLALSEAPLSAEVLSGLFPGGHHGELLRRLGARLLVELDARGRHGMHDLVRDALVSLLDTEEVRAAHVALLELLPREEVPVVVRVRAMSRHLQALGRPAERVAFIVASAELLVRHGAAGELLAWLDALPGDALTLDARLARGRALVRLLEVRRAYPELLALQASLEAQGADAGLREGGGAVLVRAALFALELDACERTLEAMPAPGGAEVFFQQLLAWAALRYFQGRIDEALELLDGAAAASDDRRARGWCAYSRALMLWLDGRDSELAEPVERGIVLLEDARADSRGALVTAMSAGIFSRLGRFAEAESALTEAWARMEELGAPRLALELDCIAAWVLAERGHRRDALVALRKVEARAERGGYLFIALLCRAGAGRVLLELGRCAEARALLEVLEGDIRRLRVLGMSRAVASARRMDVLTVESWPTRVEPREVRPGVAARQRALVALEAARRGDEVLALGLLVSMESLVEGTDFALERALGHLARACLHRLHGREVEARDALASASRSAAEGGVDPEVVPTLASHVFTDRAALRASAPVDDGGPSGAAGVVVLDARRHELRGAGRTVSLARRVLPRRLLYALASQPGRAVSKEDCVRAMWDADYDPRLHDNALRVHVSHARGLLEGMEARIVFEPPGYRLETAEGFVFVTV